MTVTTDVQGQFYLSI